MTWVETGSGFEAELCRDMLFDAGIDIGEGADGAGNGAGGDFRARVHQPLAAARELGIGLRQLDAEGGRLGMDAVAAADGDRVLVLEGAALQRGQQRVDIGEQDVGGARKLHGKAGVEHVRRGHALMDEARVRPDELGEMGQEGDDVVLGDALDLVDALDVEGRRAALFPDGLGRLLRDDAELGQRVAGMRLDLEPDAEARLGRPDGDHFRARIARDHQPLLTAEISAPPSDLRGSAHARPA